MHMHTKRILDSDSSTCTNMHMHGDDINVCIPNRGIQMKIKNMRFLGYMSLVPCEVPRTTFDLWVGGVLVLSLRPGSAV